jgi:hypothetical protein
MHPIDHYTTIRRGREELLRQAEHQRLLRIARVKRLAHQQVHVAFARWFGRQLVSWRQRLERFGTRDNGPHAPLTAPHH